MTRSNAPKKIPIAKSSVISVNEHNAYTLDPATTRTHYGPGAGGGGQPYAFRSKRAREAWIVSSRLTGKVLGVVEDIGAGPDGWSFMKIERPAVPTPQFLASKFGDMPATMWETDRRIYSGASAAAAIAAGLGVPHRAPESPARPTSTRKSAKQLQAEIDAAIAK